MRIWNRIWAAPLTPMADDGSVDLPAIDRLAEVLVARGVEGLYVCGGTGEGLLLTTEERMAVLERWRRVLGDDLPIIAHVGHASLADCRALAQHAQRAGAVAISAIGPLAVPVRDIDGLVNWSRAIAQAAPRLPFFHYHQGSVAGLPRVLMADYVPRAIDRVPNFAGVKFTYEDLADYSRCVQLGAGAVTCLYGRDEMMLPAMVSGARGFIGGTFNLTSPLVVQVREAYLAGEMAAAHHAMATLQSVARVLQRHGGLPALKAAMAMLGVSCGSARQPWTPVPPAAVDQLVHEIERVWPEFASPVRPTPIVATPTPIVTR